jgi:hypothetical protein
LSKVSSSSSLSFQVPKSTSEHTPPPLPSLS